MRRIDNSPIGTGFSEIRLFAVIRNESLRLPSWLRHYRELGVNRFFIVDNDSSDGSGVALLKEPDVHLFHTRESFDGSTLDPDQKISVMEAIKCYTIYAAYSGFEEDVKGSLEPGKLADLIVLSEDPLKVPVDRIKDIKTIMTIIDGEIAYKSSDWQ